MINPPIQGPTIIPTPSTLYASIGFVSIMIDPDVGRLESSGESVVELNVPAEFVDVIVHVTVNGSSVGVIVMIITVSKVDVIEAEVSHVNQEVYPD